MLKKVIVILLSFLAISGKEATLIILNKLMHSINKVGYNKLFLIHINIQLVIFINNY